MLTRGSASYLSLEDAARAAGEQLTKGFTTEAWVEDADGNMVLDVTEIKRRCNLT
jgi:hypothetical protein